MFCIRESQIKQSMLCNEDEMKSKWQQDLIKLKPKKKKTKPKPFDQMLCAVHLTT